ncbi:MAG: ABC transporter substrate-binding protein [Deltaproteobacteria bacterium]|nr:ABC transporter substrate-binding protein [Deltaproteobacteria bacterium]
MKRCQLMVSLSIIVPLLVLSSFPCFSQDKVRFPVGASSKTLGYSPLWVASKQGFFDQQGLDAQLVLLRGTPPAVQALVAGSLYVAGASPDAVIEVTERGLDLVMVEGVINGLTHAIMGGKNYKNYEALRGATIGGQSLTSGITFPLKQVLKSKGLEYPRDYKLVNVGGTADLFAALSSGQIAAAPLAIPLNFAAEEAGFNVIGWYRDVLPNYQLTALTVRRSWAEANRPLLIRFVKGMVLAMRWLYENKEPAVEFLTKEMKLKPAHARRGWEYYTENRIWHPDTDINVEGVKTLIQIYGEQGQIKGTLPAPAKYIDQSYLREALKELGSR